MRIRTLRKKTKNLQGRNSSGRTRGSKLAFLLFLLLGVNALTVQVGIVSLPCLCSHSSLDLERLRPVAYDAWSLVMALKSVGARRCFIF